VHVTGTPIREKQFAGVLFPESNVTVPAEAVVAGVSGDPQAGLLSSRFDSSHTGLSGNGHTRPATKRLAILGGSAGAKTLNDNVPKALYKVRNRLEGWEIFHQTGETHFESTRLLYRKLGIEATVMPFIADVPELLDRSDVTVCRAGGSTLAEVAAAGVPAVILPYPHAVADHQRKNADHFSQRGGCLLLDEREVKGRLDDRLAESLGTLLSDDKQRKQISQTLQKLGRPNAADRIATLIEEML
jgi:UDP-N-acetylglucosamine--N-acetylmuramyl-(pentapeptide) pyrophosphoryl-undecaprenol N-acetylglucosamine transferase